jgi:flagellar hook-length control protein FliK
MAAAAPWASRIELALDEAASQAESILRQVRMHVRQGMTELQLRLDPPALGELRMRLVFDAGRLRARVRTTEAATADLVKSKSGELKSAMQAAGIDITELDIATSESGGRRRKFTLSDMQELSGRTPGAPANPAPARAVAGERPPLRSASAGLDLFV